ncbi:MAG: radical SAM protein [Myxococcales bacterium]|nr:radical SAM protein [Myxococcales bacterium]
MRCAFIFPAAARGRRDLSCALLPLGLPSLAAALDAAGHRTLLIHSGGLGVAGTLRALRRFHPDLVGLSCFTYQRHETAAWVRRIRAALGKPGPFVVLGGPHASALPRAILRRWPGVDAVAEGEAEATIIELARCLGAGMDPVLIPGLWVRRWGHIESPPPRQPLPDLDRLPATLQPKLDMRGVDHRLQERHRITGRGCHGGCRFCCAPALWRHAVRRHSVDRIMAEIRALRRRGHAWLSFRDDSFVSDPAWTAELCRRLIDESADLLWDCQADLRRLDSELVALMRRAGCVQIQLGVESADDRVLQALGKPHRRVHIRRAVEACRRAGMWMSFYLLAGCPREDEAARRDTLELVRSSRPASLSVSRLSLYPGTPLSRHIPPGRWFSERRVSFFFREDAAARRYHRALLALDRACRSREPYTLAELRAAAERLDGAPAARLMLAQAALRQGEYLQAEMSCRRLLREHPQSAWARFCLGETFFEQRRFVDAAAELERALRLRPGWREVLALLRRARHRAANV